MADQSWPGSNGNEGVRRIPQSFSITGTSPSDCLVSYIQDTHSTAPADWAILFLKWAEVTSCVPNKPIRTIFFLSYFFLWRIFLWKSLQNIFSWIFCITTFNSSKSLILYVLLLLSEYPVAQCTERHFSIHSKPIIWSEFYLIINLNLYTFDSTQILISNGLVCWTFTTIFF